MGEQRSRELLPIFRMPAFRRVLCRHLHAFREFSSNGYRDVYWRPGQRWEFWVIHSRSQHNDDHNPDGYNHNNYDSSSHDNSNHINCNYNGDVSYDDDLDRAD